jgi:hypothetical protein
MTVEEQLRLDKEIADFIGWQHEQDAKTKKEMGYLDMSIE